MGFLTATLRGAQRKFLAEATGGTFAIFATILLAFPFEGWAQKKGFSILEVQRQIESNVPEIDTNGDGKIDLWRTFDAGGKIVEIRYDNNADAQPDEWIRYSPNRTIREIARSFNGLIDERDTQEFERNFLIRRRKETLVAGNWKTVELWEVQPNRKVAKVTRWLSQKIEESFEPLAVK
jgi:hypothetical protein